MEYEEVERRLKEYQTQLHELQLKAETLTQKRLELEEMVKNIASQL